jgi:hypothetical protein
VSGLRPQHLPASWDVHHAAKREYGDYSVYAPNQKPPSPPLNHQQASSSNSIKAAGSGSVNGAASDSNDIDAGGNDDGEDGGHANQ